MREYVEKQIQQMINGYFANPNQIVENYKREITNKKEYSGREILELLQNAVDELNDEKPYVEISFENNILRVCNNGSTFTKEGLLALMYSDMSPKFKKSNYIGNKGTGFKAVLNWASYVRIYSGELSIEFSSQNATDSLSELLSDKYASKNQLLKEAYEKGEINGVATLRFPKWIEQQEKNDYDTIIEIKVQEQFCQDVKNQIEEITSKTVLFLPKIKLLTINLEGEKRCYEKREEILENADTDTRRVIITKNNTEEKCWTLLEDHGSIEIDGEEKKYSVSVAYNPNYTMESNRLFCFFKTSISLPLGFLVNATVELDGRRENLVKSSFNNEVINKCYSLAIKLAKSLSEKSFGYDALALLALRGGWNEYFVDNGLVDIYYKMVSNAEIFPTVNNTYIQFTRDTIFCDSELWPLYLKGDGFDELLIYTDIPLIINLLRELTKRVYARYSSYSYEYLCKYINNQIETIKDDKKRLAGLCKCFVDYYSNELKNKAQKPLLLVDSNDNIIDDNSKAFIPPEGEEITIPSFAKIKYISRELIEALKEQFSCNNAELAKNAEPLNVRRYDVINVITLVFSELSRTDNKTAINCKEAIVWLFNQTRSTEVSFENIKFDNKLLLVARDGSVQDAQNLYYGKEYGNQICENLLPNKDECFVKGADYYDFENSDELKELLIQLGVKKEPRLIKEQKFYDASEFYKELSKQQFNSVEYETIENIDYILANAKTTDIIRWIRGSDIKHKIEKRTEELKYYLKHQGSKYQNISYAQERSWINYIFSTSKWIELPNNKRVAPRNCAMIKGVENLSSIIYELGINDYLDKDDTLDDREELALLMKKLGAVDEFCKLPAETLYQCLLELSRDGVDENGITTRRIYNSLLQDEASHELVKSTINEDGKYRKEFFEHGMVYCKGVGFVSYKNAKYSIQSIPSKMLSECLIDIPARRSADFIKIFLGVEKLERNYTVQSHTKASIHDDFQQDLEGFRKYLLQYRKKDANESEKRIINSLQIVLCSSVEIISNGEAVELDNFAYARDRGDIVYLKSTHPSSLNQLKDDDDFCEAIVNIFLDAIKLSVANRDMSSLLRNVYQKDERKRKMCLKKDFPDVELEMDEKAFLENKRKTLLQKLKEFKGEGELDESKLDCINYADIDRRENYIIIIEIAKELGISLVCLEGVLGKVFNIKGFLENELNNWKVDNSRAYKTKLYYSYLENDKEPRKFLLDYEAFKNFRFDDYSSLYSIKDAMENEFCELTKCVDGLESADEIYIRNLSELIKGKDETVFKELLDSSREIDSLVYFKKIEELSQEYASYVDKKSEEEGERKILLESNSKKVFSIEDYEYKENNAKQDSKSHTLKAKGATGKPRGASTRDNEFWGGKAEEYVFNSLKEIKNDVRWVSENARKATGENHNPDGRAGLGYDITYKDENGETIYVEVKSSKGNSLDFKISANELNVGERNRKNYIIIMVLNVEDEDVRLVNLGNIFDYAESETRNDNSRFSISSDNYNISVF